MADTDVGKLFVGGISRETTDATLRDHFSKYGDVSSSIVAVDRYTALPRGFGFVTFSDPGSVDLALRDQHFIAGRPVEVKKAIPRHEQQSNTQQHQQRQPQRQQPNHSHTSKLPLRNVNNGSSFGGSINDQYARTKKIFVGGLSANLTEEEFKNYFEQFGKITDVVVMHDNNTNRPRGFGFITFDSEEVVEKLMQKSHHELGGKHVEVKRAIPREATKTNGNGNNTNSRFGGLRFSPSANYPDDANWVRGPSPYLSYPGQYPVSTTYPGYYYGAGYPAFGGYGVFGYGMPVVPPRTPWNGMGVMGVRPLPYGTGYYPTGVNGGFAFLGMINGYNGVVDTTHVHHHQMNGARLDIDNSNLRVEKGVVNGKKTSKVPPVGQSS